MKRKVVVIPIPRKLCEACDSHWGHIVRKRHRDETGLQLNDRLVWKSFKFGSCRLIRVSS